MQKVISICEGTARHPLYRLRHPVTLELIEGECIAVMGPNGGGKSMLIDMLTGSHPLLGQPVQYDFSPSKLPLVSDNIKCLTFRDTYGTGDERYYHQMRWNQWENPDPLMLLSSGELRRLRLNEVLKTKPRVLVLDNPFIGLDIQARDELSRTLCSLAKEEDVLLILVLSRWEDIPACVTHIVEVSEGIVGQKIPRSEWKQPALPSVILSEEKRQAIFNLPIQETPQSDIVLDFRDVTIRYGSRTLLNRLCWTVKRGEHWSLSGPNGSGKSTLLSIVCADNPQAYANDITLFGHRRGSGESIWEIKKNIGYVSPEMYRACRSNQPVLQIVAAGLLDANGYPRRPGEEQMRACFFWMDVFGISNLTDRSFMSLSSGEQRLVLLARAFVKSPPLLILDEPLHGLDAYNRQLVRDVIDTYMQNPSKTLIMVTHYAEELPACINRHFTMNPPR